MYEVVFYATIIELVNDILIFTLGIYLIQKSVNGEARIQNKKSISPGMLGVLIGLLLFLLKIQLPESVGQGVKLLVNATTPLTMFMIGFQIGGLNLKELLKDFRVYGVCVLKLLVIPIGCLALFK